MTSEEIINTFKLHKKDFLISKIESTEFVGVSFVQGVTEINGRFFLYLYDLKEKKFIWLKYTNGDIVNSKENEL